MAKTWDTKALTDDLIGFAPTQYSIGKTFLAVREVCIGDHIGRADVLMMQYTFKPTKALILEVKVSRGDLLADLRANKWRKYLEVGAVIFCFPLGMAYPHEIPKEAGIMVRDELSWKIIRRPIMKGVPETNEYLHKRIIFALNRDMHTLRVEHANALHNIQQADMSTQQANDGLNHKEVRGWGDEGKSIIQGGFDYRAGTGGNASP